MAIEPSTYRRAPRAKGLRAGVADFISSATRFLGSRLALASREAKAAASRIVVVIACAAAALMLLLTGYIFLIVFAIVGIARLIGISWIWISLIAAFLHFAVALFCLILARGELKHPLFQDTASVLKEDSEWLKNLNQK